MRALTNNEVQQISAGIPPVAAAAITGGVVQAAYDVTIYTINAGEKFSLEEAAKVAAVGFVMGATLAAVAARLQRMLRM